MLIYSPKSDVVREYPNDFATRDFARADTTIQKMMVDERKRGQKDRKKQQEKAKIIGKKRQEIPNVYLPDLDDRAG